MTYCLRYNNKSENLDKVGEISIRYEGQDITLLDFLKANYLYRIILRVEDIPAFFENQEWRKLNAIRKQYSEYKFAVCFCRAEDRREFLEEVKNLECEWFTDKPIVDWDMLHHYAAIGVSDVYIAEALGFELPAVRRFCSTHNLRIRVWPNVAQNSIKSVMPLRSFFIRPEDLDIYSPYIDTIEFWGPIEKQDVNLRIYRDTKVWPYDLAILITGLESTQNSIIKPTFGKTRLNCGKQCLKDGQCYVCGHVSHLSKLMRELNIIPNVQKSMLIF